MTTKACKKCKQEKPMTEYSKGQGKCKSCRKHLRVEQYDDTQRENRKQHYSDIEKPKLKEQTREQLRAEFLGKYNLEHRHDMLERNFETVSGYKFVDTFMHEDDFEDMLINIQKRNPQMEPKAVEPPEEIMVLIKKRNSEDIRYVRDIRVIVFNELCKLSLDTYLLKKHDNNNYVSHYYHFGCELNPMCPMIILYFISLIKAPGLRWS